MPTFLLGQDGHNGHSTGDAEREQQPDHGVPGTGKATSTSGRRQHRGGGIKPCPSLINVVDSIHRRVGCGSEQVLETLPGSRPVTMHRTARIHMGIRMARETLLGVL